MQNQELSRQWQRLKHLFNQAPAACGSDAEMLSHWAQYLCVLVAGFLENAIREVYGDYARRNGSPALANFVSSALRRVKNPKSVTFVEVAGRFKRTWRDDLERFLAANGRKEAIDSIMTHRHLIAHGQRSEITLARLSGYCDRAVEVIDFIETQCA